MSAISHTRKHGKWVDEMKEALRPSTPWVILRRAWITEGGNKLGLRDSEDEKITLPSPSPGAWTDRLKGEM